MGALTLDIGGRRFGVVPSFHDISIPLNFDRQQLQCFGAPAAQERTYVAGSFTGDVRRGGSCNCSTYTLTPHCNGTHTECVGHITGERLSVVELCKDAWGTALLISVEIESAQSTSEHSSPAPNAGDLLVTRASIEAALGHTNTAGVTALVIRTRPNDGSKKTRNYDSLAAAYFSAQAMQFVVELGIEHLIVDLPSVDRAEDQGKLTAHRIFWNVPSGSTTTDPATRRSATITELAYIDESIADGLYLLNLQIAPFTSDAAPSRPLLMPLIAS